MKGRYIVMVAWIAWSPLVWADRVCLERATGKLLEYQSRMDEGTCLKNWVTNNPQLGYVASDIEERELTPAAWALMREEKIDKPERAAAAVREAERQVKVSAIRAKLVLGQLLTAEEAKEVVR